MLSGKKISPPMRPILNFNLKTVITKVPHINHIYDTLYMIILFTAKIKILKILIFHSHVPNTVNVTMRVKVYYEKHKV